MGDDNELKKLIERIPHSIEKVELSQTLKLKYSEKALVPSEVAELLKYFSENSERPWDYKKILGSISETFTQLNWRQVFEETLKKQVNLDDPKVVSTLVKSWTCISGVLTIPYEIFFKYASRLPVHRATRFYKIIINNETENISLYSNIFLTKLVTQDEIRQKYKKTILFNSNLNCVELFNSIQDNNGLIEYIRTTSPEYCLIGLGEILRQKRCEKKGKCSEECEHRYAHRKTFIGLLKHFIEISTTHFVYFKLFDSLRSQMLDLMQEIDVSLTRLLDVLLEHKQLSLVTETLVPFEFCCELVVLSSRRDHLNLSLWLKHLEDFPRFINFLHRRICVENKDFFPFTAIIVRSIVKILESMVMNAREGENAKTRRNKYSDLGEKLREISSFVENQSMSKDRIMSFFMDIIHSNINVDGVINKIRKMTYKDEMITKETIFNGFMLNYSNLANLPNSETLAKVLAEIIKRGFLGKKMFKKVFVLINKSLAMPASDRECSFSFCIFEALYNFYPDEFSEVEDLERIKACLIKKEIMIVDDFSKPLIVFSEAIETITGFKTNESIVEEIINDVESNQNKEEDLDVENQVFLKFNELQIFTALLLMISNNKPIVVTFLESAPEDIRFRFLAVAFQLLQRLLEFSTEIEDSVYQSIGSILGQLILRNDRPVFHDFFDIETFVYKGVEYRSISLIIEFLVSFLSEAQFSQIYVPNNPWLMKILALCTELYSCTLKKHRERLRQLFSLFGVELHPKAPKTILGPLALYRYSALKVSYDTDGNLSDESENNHIKEIVRISLDFTIRECHQLVLKDADRIARPLLLFSFKNLIAKDFSSDETKMYFKNFLRNVIDGVVVARAQDVVRKAMTDNLKHFLKISSQTLDENILYQIIADNLLIALKIVKDTVNTSVVETFDKYTEGLSMMLNAHSNENIKLCSYFQILMVSDSSAKKSLRTIRNGEYQEIKDYLVHLSSDSSTPFRKPDFFLENFMRAVGRFRYPSYRRMMKYIMNESSNRDEDCFSVAKCLIGEAIRCMAEGKDCEFLYDFMHQIFVLSPRAKRAAIGWVVYSDNNTDKFRLIRELIKHDFVSLEEFDTSMAMKISAENKSGKETEGKQYYLMVTALLTYLLFNDIVICSPYSFTRTIRKLSEKTADPSVSKFLRKIEISILDFGNVGDQRNIFQEFIEIPEILRMKYSQLHMEFRQLYDINEFNFMLSLKTCWYHYLFYSGNYRYLKIDILAHLIIHDACSCLYKATCLLTQACEKKIFAYSLFFCRFFVTFLDSIVEKTRDSQNLQKIFHIFIIKLLEVTNPVAVPHFACQWMEIIQHPFFDDCSEQELFYFFASLLYILEYNSSFEYPIYLYFTSSKREYIVKKFNTYLSFLCPNYCIGLKNFFNNGSRSSTFYSNNSFFSRNSSHYSSMDAVDFMSTSSIDHLRPFYKSGDKKMFFSIIIRYHGKHPPDGIKKAYNELLKIDEKLVREIEDKYYIHDDNFNKQEY